MGERLLREEHKSESGDEDTNFGTTSLEEETALKRSSQAPERRIVLAKEEEENIEAEENIEEGGEHTKIFCFHAPPWNSIDHLHLHCIRTPFAGLFQRIKYTPGSLWCVAHEEVRESLLQQEKEQGHTVTATKAQSLL